MILQSQDYDYSILPVEFLSLTATPLSKTVEISWQTASEKNAQHFEVERSRDGKVFSEIGQVKAIGQSSVVQHYTFIEGKPTNGINYYRLRQVDRNGKKTLTHTISTIFQSNNKLTIYPNPVSTVLTIETTDTGNFQIINLLGQTLIQGKVANRIDVSALPQGTYILKIGEEQARFVKP